MGHTCAVGKCDYPEDTVCSYRWQYRVQRGASSRDFPAGRKILGSSEKEHAWEKYKPIALASQACGECLIGCVSKPCSHDQAVFPVSTTDLLAPSGTWTACHDCMHFQNVEHICLHIALVPRITWHVDAHGVAGQRWSPHLQSKWRPRGAFNGGQLGPGAFVLRRHVLLAGLLEGEGVTSKARTPQVKARHAQRQL